MISVWHNTKFMDYMLKGVDALKDTIAHHAAHVATAHLEVAYRLTNHIDDDWTKNELVTVSDSKTHRSTSVGDLMIHDDKCFVVEVCGFREISREEQAEIKFIS